jgi:hypothetical protein
VEPVAKPSPQGRSEIFPALNRFLIPEENVRSAGGQPREGTAPSRVAPEPPLFFSVSASPIFREEPGIMRGRGPGDGAGHQVKL